MPLPYSRIFQTIGLHLFLLFAAFSVLLFLDFTSQIPGLDNLNRWDTGWYLYIVEKGYVWQEGQSNVAFFPLFPYLWRWLHLGVIGITVLNAVVFLGAFAFLARTFAFKEREIFFFLSAPSLMFMYVPYSEAVFFLFSTILLAGLYKRNNYLVVAGLFLCCISRSATVFFVPAIIFTEFLDLPGWHWPAITRKLKQAALYLGAVAAAILFVGLVQWQQTGRWFPFLGVQEHWQHVFKMPQYPLTTWGGIRLLWLDGPALWLGIVAGLFCTFMLFQFFQRQNQSVPLNRAAVFAAGYLVGVSLFIIFFQQYSIHSLNRYVFATPYFMVFLWSLARQMRFSLKGLTLVFLLSLPLWLLFKAHTKLDGLTHLQTVWYFVLITLYGVAMLALGRKQFAKPIVPVLYGANILLQLYLLDLFLRGEWVG